MLIYEKYYLYRHIRLDKNEVFYVGIGTKSDKRNYLSFKTEYTRAFDIKGRSLLWNRIKNIKGYTVEILFETNSLELIKQKEIEFIKLYGRKDLNTGTLANMTDGGDGNFNPSEEERVRRAKKQRGKKRTEEHKRKQSESRKGSGNPMFGYEWSKEQRKNKSEKSKGKKFGPGFIATEEFKNKLRKKYIERINNGYDLYKPLFECENCGLFTSKANNKRWHGNNCKAKKD